MPLNTDAGTAHRAVRTLADLEFSSPNGHSLCLDLHLPAGRAPAPCVMYFHGGGWAMGSRKEHAVERLLPLAAAGIAVASVDYRLTDVATHPAQLEDACSAAAWLRAHADELGIRGERIGAWGASAGAWLALMLAYVPTRPQSTVQAVCAWFPVTEILTVSEQRRAAGLPLPPFLPPSFEPTQEPALLGVSKLSDDLGLAQSASPITHAKHASGPTLLIHGDADALINVAQSVDLHDALLAAGCESQLILLRGADHEDPQFDTPPVLGAVSGFFRAQLAA